MPILDVEIIASDSSQSLPAHLTQALADAAAKVFGTLQGRVWVKVHIIPPEHYAEDHGTPKGVQPVFVTVTKAKMPKGNALEAEITQLTKSIASLLQRPETNVHITYQPDAAGRVAFGGRLVK
ncbi:MAG: hypothetical protein Kow002_04450 [Anaerolineales bacterium]